MSRPVPAKGTFPYRDHRTVAEVDADQRAARDAANTRFLELVRS